MGVCALSMMQRDFHVLPYKLIDNVAPMIYDPISLCGGEIFNNYCPTLCFVCRISTLLKMF